MSDPQQLRYTVDITSKDIDAIEAFLTTRTAEQFTAHEPGTIEHRMAGAVEWGVKDLVVDARIALEWLADPEQADLHGELDLRHDLRRAWNLLVRMTNPWRRHPGHDTARWCRVTYTDAQSEKDMKRGVERARAAREAREAASA
ncbi:hypothetical protein ABZ896_03455 [Streptomyces sp. NPDC047072]|uniref:hypothetical protein n=1 Tax=Streptomyces sp. NPDC047072 TaxID=3154809 RepID=UPI0034018A52